MDGTDLPNLVAPVPGPVSQQWVDRLAATECPAITARRARRSEKLGVDQDPIVWAKALGANVEDVDGNRYVDLTSAFGVASLGHRAPMVVDAINRQAESLLHGMGDVFPSTTKIEFSEALAAFCPDGLQHSILGLNGSDAVTAALKTAVMATGNSGVIAFEDSYHGLFYGPLAVSGYRREFREPFVDQLNPHVFRFPFPDDVADVAAVVREIKNTIAAHPIGAIIVEPILGRGGERPAPPTFLESLRSLCHRTDTLLIFDEIWTGLYRTGDRFACQHDGVTPDVMCLGKSLGGGMPLSAAIGSREVMKRWGQSTGEAVHTATFLGHPISCAAGLAVLDVLSDSEISDSIVRRGEQFTAAIESAIADRPVSLRGRGWLQGIVFEDAAHSFAVWQKMMQQGYLTLPSGARGEVLALTPPFVITERQIEGAIEALRNAIEP